jgi:methylmalonyl-CoA/ethylmalonyl-CoA epimerase
MNLKQFGLIIMCTFIVSGSLAADKISACVPAHPHINHTGIFVKSIDETLKTYKKMGFPMAIEDATHPSMKFRVAVVAFQGTHLELLQGDPNMPDGSLSKGITQWIDKHGEGYNHIAIEVPDIKKTMACLTSQGIKLEKEKPQAGATGWVAFTDTSSPGTRIEFVQTFKKKGLFAETGEMAK